MSSSSSPGGRARGAALVVALGAVAAVLAAAPYKTFDLDRYFVPKELALYATATLATALCISRARRITLAAADVALLGYLALSVISALFAPNKWLAERAIGVSLAGAAVYWTAKALARAGAARPVLIGIALAAVVAACTSLLQAYGYENQYMSVNRAPGGTLGNRNFVAHVAAIGAPMLVLCVIEARNILGSFAATLGVAACSAALFMSRSRGAWLAVIVGAAVCVVCGLLGKSRWHDARRAGRVVLLIGATVAGVAAAWLLPNTLDWNSRSPYLDSVRGIVNSKEGSGLGRVVQYKHTLLIAKAHPLLGVGPGNWPVAYPRVAPRGDPSLDHETGMTSNPWPSSDWMAAIAERGAPAALLLLFVFATIALSAVRAMYWAKDGTAFVAAVALLATLVATLIVGAFDAVMLLALPSLLVWAALGALGPLAAQAPKGGERALSDAARKRLLVAVIVTGSAFALRGVLQLVAMASYSSGERTVMIEHAARADPGSYRIRLRLAESYASRGDCEGVRKEGGAAHALFPEAAAPKRLLSSCGVKSGR
ncbi:MAG: O-antigen ligase family protein, partial [Gemmatimonadaceae bacterium]